MYCTYLTVYYGNKMPPFYIGYGKTSNVVYKNYRGTPASKAYKNIFKKEEKYNPHLFKTFILSKYETGEEAKKQETKLQKHFQVHKNSMYINMHIQGNRYHNTSPHSDETKRKISMANKGKDRFSKEAKENISIRMKNKLNVIDKNGNKYFIDKSDPRYISGELYSIRVGYVHAKATIDKMSKNNPNNKGKLPHWDSNGNTKYLSIEEALSFPEYSRESPQRLTDLGKKNGRKIFVILKETNIQTRIDPENFNTTLHIRKKIKSGGFVGFDKINSMKRIIDLKNRKHLLVEKDHVLKEYEFHGMNIRFTTSPVMIDNGVVIIGHSYIKNYIDTTYNIPKHMKYNFYKEKNIIQLKMQDYIYNGEKIWNNS